MAQFLTAIHTAEVGRIDTEARHSQGEPATARERPQAGSRRLAMMDVINLTGELRHSIETAPAGPVGGLDDDIFAPPR
jgi:hypothetical protein